MFTGREYTSPEATRALARRRPMACELIGSLAEDYPELRAFTADATLNEIKVLYGLSSFEQVLVLGRERIAHRGL